MCTTIKIDSNEGYVLARTMDFESPLIYNGLYMPKDYVFMVDLEDNLITSKYEAMGVVFYKSTPFKDGINTKGLMGCTNYYHAFNIHDDKIQEGKVNISSLDYMNYALLTYADVDELCNDLDNIHISSKNSKGEAVICPDFHHMFVDKNGKCVVVEPKNKEYVFYDNPYDVMTNSPSFKSHVKKLEKYFYEDDNLENFNGSKSLPGGYDPASRFIKSHYFVRTQEKSLNQRDALKNAYDIMDAIRLPKGFIYSNKHEHNIYTRYIAAYDNKNLLMTAKSRSNQKVYCAEFDDFNSTNPVFFPFDTDFSMEKFDF